MHYWFFVTLLTQLGKCRLQKWFLVVAFVTVFLVSRKKYQSTIIHIMPIAGRNHGSWKNSSWKLDMFDQQKTSNSMQVPRNHCKLVIISSFRTTQVTIRPDGTRVVLLLKPGTSINIWWKSLGLLGWGWHHANDSSWGNSSYTNYFLIKSHI